MAYSYQRSIDALATAVNSNQSNFPVVLLATVSDWATTGNGGHIENTDANGGASGSLTVPADFVVCTDPSNPDGTQLPHEFADYDPTSGYVELYFEIDVYNATSDTTIYFLYGDSAVTTSQENVAAVWANDFDLVLHFATATGIYDSAGGLGDGTDYSTDSVTGELGDGRFFDTSNNERIQIETAAAISWLNGLESRGSTISTWCKPDTNVDQQPILWTEDSDREPRIECKINNDQVELWVYSDIGSANAMMPMVYPGTSWGHYVFLIDPLGDDMMHLYYNGSDKAGTGATNDSITQFSSSEYLTIGAQNKGGSINVDGSFSDLTLDEFRLASVLRTADWIEAQYNNQSDPAPSGGFWSAISAEQSAPPPISILTLSQVSLGGLTQVLTFSLGAVATSLNRVLLASNARLLNTSLGQRLRPMIDTLIDQWTTQDGDTSGLYDAIDELVANDDDYVRSEVDPTVSPVVFKIEQGDNPTSSANHWVRYRYSRVDGTRTVNLTAQLREGYTDEGSPGTLIAEWQHNDIGDSVVQADQVLTAEEADSITDYGDLYLRFVANS